MSDIFREIDEELRRDNLWALWARHGRYIIAAAVVVVALAAGFAAWRSHQQALRQAQSARFASALALAQAGKDADAAAVFSTMDRSGGGYSVLAAFENAALLTKQGEPKKAAAAYDRIAQSDAAGPALRDLATLLSVMQETLATDPKTAVARLKPLTAAGDPWRPTALEMTAAAQLKLGNSKSALEIYKGLADDPTAPRNLRARAAEMTAALSS